MKNPKVSLILPVFNEAAYLDQCFQSVLNQTHQNVELCVSDNASSDQTWEMMQKYQAQYPDRFKIFHFAQPVHAFENMKKCVEMATGELCIHFGGDDYLKTNDFLENAVKPFLGSEPVGGHFIRLEYINAATGQFIVLNPPDYVEEFLYKDLETFVKEFVLEVIRDDMFIGVFHTELFRKTLFETYRFAVESAGWWIVLKIFLIERQLGKKFVFDSEKKCILMKRVQKQPTGKVQSAAAASANLYDAPAFRVKTTLKYCFQTANVVKEPALRKKILWILLFHPRRKTRGFPTYLAPGVAFCLGSPLWARLYMRSKDIPIRTVVKNKFLKIHRAQSES